MRTLTKIIGCTKYKNNATTHVHTIENAVCVIEMNSLFKNVMIQLITSERVKSAFR